jgi:hypothetical protein
MAAHDTLSLLECYANDRNVIKGKYHTDNENFINTQISRALLPPEFDKQLGYHKQLEFHTKLEELTMGRVAKRRNLKHGRGGNRRRYPSACELIAAVEEMVSYGILAPRKYLSY